MSLDWDASAVGFNVLYGAVVVAYGADSGPIGAFTMGAPPSASNTAGSWPTSQPTVSLAAAETMAGSLTPAVNLLSGRQLDVLRLIVQGRSNKEIARVLNLAEGTVKIHVAGLFSKLGVHRRAAVAIAGARFLSEAAPQSMTSTQRASGSRPRRAPLPRHSVGSETSRAGRSNSRPNVGLLGRS